MLLISTNISAQNLSIPTEGYLNSFGPAASTGVFLNKKGTIWGAEIDYSRILYKSWIINLSFNYEQEKEEVNSGSYSTTNSFYPNLALGYAFSPRIAAGIGIGKTIFDDDNEENKMKFNPNGDWTIGVVGLYSFHITSRHVLDVSIGMEKALSNPDISMSLELGYGYNF